MKKQIGEKDAITVTAIPTRKREKMRIIVKKGSRIARWDKYDSSYSVLWWTFELQGRKPQKPLVLFYDFENEQYSIHLCVECRFAKENEKNELHRLGLFLEEKGLGENDYYSIGGVIGDIEHHDFILKYRRNLTTTLNTLKKALIEFYRLNPVKKPAAI